MTPRTNRQDFNNVSQVLITEYVKRELAKRGISEI